MSKYVDLQTECQRICDKKVEVIPVITGATAVVDKNMQSNLKKIPGKHNINNCKDQQSLQLHTS